MSGNEYDIGVVGLGVMGRNFVLNMADHGFSAVGFDKDPAKAEALEAEAGPNHHVHGCRSIKEFVSKLRKPRAALMLVPAGEAVDSVIGELAGHLKKGDVLIDAGNSFFRDTDRRHDAMARKGIHYLGVGVSGGESGARHGPSIMPGGPEEGYERVREIFEAAAADVDGEPCVTYLGPRSAGHYVKMIHNGIEYGIMQLIAETYDVMKRGLGFDNDRLHQVYAEWNAWELSSFLVEITADIFVQDDEKTGQRLLDVILDEASQKGTGMWTSESTLEMHVPAPTIDLAVAMRDMSTYKNQRRQAQEAFRQGPDMHYRGDPDRLVRCLRDGLYASMLITYAQGMAVLAKASGELDYGLDLEAVARIWRGGCIIRSAMLEDLRAAFGRKADLPDLLIDREIAEKVQAHQKDLRDVVATSAELGIPAPAFGVSLAYLDSYRSAWLPANLIQAQRDYFGSHTYKRIDAEGSFHTHWLRAGAMT